MDSFRYKNLVYLPFTKHASRTYFRLFGDILQWQPEQSWQIDWQQDHVFAHIIHPYERHLKGTAQCIDKYQLNELLNSESFVRLLGTAVFDLHSYPLSVALGSRTNQIDWLMLDHPTITGNELTARFLQQHGIDISAADIPQENVSNNSKKELTATIRELRDREELKGTLAYFYEQDVNLYNSIKKQTLWDQIFDRPWDQCNWLRKTY
jgi:hypothetical protein